MFIRTDSVPLVRLDFAVGLGTVPVVVQRPVFSVLSRGQRRPFTAAAAVMVHLAVRPAVLRLLFPLVDVMRVLLATAAARLLLLSLGLFFLLHSLVFGAPVLEPDFNLSGQTDVTKISYARPFIYITN